MRSWAVRSPFWSMGFRPFFLLVIVFAVAVIVTWVLQFTGFSSHNFSPLTASQWHANEMLFGFLMAAIIGFLLTASANWTGTRGVRGWSLLIIFGLFLLTRVVFWTTPFESIWVYRFVGVIVPTWLTFHLAKLFIKTKNRRNLIMIVPLSTLIAGQMILLSSKYALGYELALFSVRFLVIVIAGRVIPFFTKKALGLEPKWSCSLLEKLTILSAFLLIFEPFYRDTFVGGQIWVGLTFLAMILNSFRLVNWRFFPSSKIGILFVLYLAYLWLPIHFALNLAGHLGWFDDFGKAGLHSLAYGCLGIMILGIIHRVSLGHTGRPIEAGRLALTAYAMIFLGSFLRVSGPLFMPVHYSWWMKSSGVLWSAAFFMVGIKMIPMLIGPRADGKKY